MNTNFCDDGMPKEGPHCIFLSNILTTSVIEIGKNHCPQLFLKECEFIVKEKNISKYISDDLELSPDESDEEISDKELIDL